MKCIDIIPIRYDGLGCFYDSVISIAAWRKLEYELAFSDSWKFNFLHQNAACNSIITDRIEITTDHIDKLLKEYCGINTYEHATNNVYTTLRIIKEQLNIRIPTIISIDTFWCPWSGDYQKYHFDHYCTVVGTDDSLNLYCIDPTLDNKVFILPFDHFIHCNNTYYSLVFDKPKYIEDYGVLLKNSIEEVIKMNIFDKIREFADEFKKAFDFCLEIGDPNISLWRKPIFFKINKIAGSRIQYAEFIKYISQKTNSNQLMLFYTEFQRSASKWRTIKAILTKCYYSKFDEDARKKISNYLLQIADFEENMAGLIYNFNHGSFNVIDSWKNEVHKVDIKNFKMTYVYLDDYFNNNGFGTSLSCNCTANLNMDQYFQYEILPSNDILRVEDMSFIFPEISDGKNDNISCEGQIIKVPKGEYESIMLLGCSECGNFLENMTIVYENGATSILTIAFTEWAHSPQYGEVEAYKGRCIGNDGKNAQVLNGIEVRLFAKEYSINSKGQIESLELPFCPNMHIFAITMKLNKEVTINAQLT